MTKFELKIESGNAAFTDEPHEECARILKEIATQLEQGFETGLCCDYNGNRVGTWDLENED